MGQFISKERARKKAFAKGSTDDWVKVINHVVRDRDARKEAVSIVRALHNKRWRNTSKT